MFQRMTNHVAIDVPDVDLYTVSEIEVCFEQQSTDVELVYKDDKVSVSDEHQLIVEVPKDDAMQLDNHFVEYQVMFIRDNGYSDATKVKKMPVNKLLKEDGYGY